MCSHLAAEPVQTILSQYQPVITKFNDELQNHQGRFNGDPDSYWQWMSDHFVPLWSKQESLRQLSSEKQLSSLSTEQSRQLSSNVDATMQRYAFEILENYSGQTFVINKVELDDENPSYATLIMTAEWDNFPDLEIDLLLVNEANNWRFYDLKYGWFSYIGTKKWSYRRGLKKTRFDSFMATLAGKNQKYFNDMCARQELQKSMLCQVWMRQDAAK